MYKNYFQTDENATPLQELPVDQLKTENQDLTSNSKTTKTTTSHGGKAIDRDVRRLTADSEDRVGSRNGEEADVSL